MTKLTTYWFHLIKLVALLPISILFSCQDEILSDKDFDCEGEYINFGIREANSLDAQREFGMKDSEQFVLRSEDSSDSLCVKAEVTNGINLNLNQEKTRATANSKNTVIEGYGSFGVFAYWKKPGQTDTHFLMNNEQVKYNKDSNTGNWVTDNTYFWPGENHKLRFFGYAPYDAPNIVVPQNTTNPIYEFKYTVPQDVKSQKDILVSLSDELPGDVNKAVPMTFKHACSAVRFSIGKNVQPGKITSIKIKGVYNRGSYTMLNSKWRVDDQSRKDFELNVDLQLKANASTQPTIDDVFLMIPQQLPKGACIEIAFQDKGSRNTRILSAPIEGSFWAMGKTTNYIISISPEYVLRFDQAPVKQDAHFVIYPIKVHVDNSFKGEWTITSSNAANLTLRTDLTELEKEGYWIEEDKGKGSISGKNKGDFTIYAFLTENASDKARNFTLTLSSNKSGIKSSTFAITQNCPLWIGNAGSERIEESDAPWGYAWDRVVTYRSVAILTPIHHITAGVIIWLTGADPYAEVTDEKLHSIIKITYSYFNSLGKVASSMDDGFLNTDQLISYKSINAGIDLEQYFDQWVADGWYTKSHSGGVYDLSNFAAKNALMKNRFHKQTKQDKPIGGQITEVDVPVLHAEDFVWFLPSSSQYTKIKDTEYPLNGVYWTSTAVPNSSNTYIYTATDNVGSLSTEGVRMQTHKIRAMRKR